ncbi:short-chain dehydrogenase [Mycolicibacterium duvalii]|uniref:3-oxoacyl-[acyl-carrier-protein] reductase MabA n=1 Tax=Mycolicibacterium duvalii TaxID=39688 RepID=A0A7I7K0F6_9MYCO|nr:SDR family oxidoreductase [Mycolicibacterium duvalii]MCV7370758.1 SDR family oxidoreductase [Mycolicibacterium duvalii]PEG37870.1 short-chain dehydrogenase [Mycolicibacterium duvalii]BBX16999.1 short-chain dehydrogenase [Mycolicibacterium duvalii]
MDYGIVGRTALVVGGSKGIGFEAAKMLAAEGCRVAIVARTQRHIDNAVAAITDAGGEAVGVSADMSTQDGIESAVSTVRDRLAPPSIVITQADFHVRGFFAEVTRAEDYVDSYRTYTLSQVHMLHAVLPAMRDDGWGRYVHIGSATAKEPQNKPPHTVANATRPSTVGLLKSVADEYAQFGITINTVAPGWIATKTTNWYLSTHEGLTDDDARRRWMMDHAGVPAARLGEPSEIASTIVYLCSQQAGYLTGHYIAVDGGHHRAAF